MCTLREIWILPINWTIWRPNDVKMYPEVGYDQYFLLCNFHGRSMSGFKVIEEPWSQEAKKNPFLHRVNRHLVRTIDYRYHFSNITLHTYGGGKTGNKKLCRYLVITNWACPSASSFRGIHPAFYFKSQYVHFGRCIFKDLLENRGKVF